MPPYLSPPPPTGRWPPPVPPYGQYGAPVQQTEPLSIWSLVLGMVSFFVCPLVGGIAALITGSKAKKAIDASGGVKAGRGMAVAGQVLGAVDIMASLVIGAVLIAFLSLASHHVSYTHLAKGDCFNRDTSGVFADRVTKVACRGSHLGEVVGSFDAPDGPWPGAVGIRDVAGPRCGDMASQYTAARPPGLGVYFLYPSQHSWDNGTRLVVCELHNQDGTKRVGPVGP